MFKVCKNRTKTASYQACYICGATPKQMNNLDSIKKRPVNEDAFNFGLSTLHARIRFMELVLKISYNMSFKKWTIRNDPAAVQAKKDKKRAIQLEFRRRLGLHIDKPRADGSGNSNDGNTARRFFNNIEVVADITGFDINLLRRFKIILEAITCGEDIDPDKFDSYSMETAQMYTSLYNWYYMPASVHKILVHGGDVIRHHMDCPIGALSEEAQEARNKDLKIYRRDNTRKCSRILSNTDLMGRLLVSSDAYISSMRLMQHIKAPTPVSPETKLLFRTDNSPQ